MKKILYNIAVFSLCIVMLASLSKGQGDSRAFLALAIGIISFVNTLHNIYIYLFNPARKRFRKIVAEMEWSLWGFGEDIYNDDLINEFKGIVQNRAGESMQSSIDFERSNREFRKRFKKS